MAICLEEGIGGNIGKIALLDVLDKNFFACNRVKQQSHVQSRIKPVICATSATGIAFFPRAG
jgi:hypothetical protein